MLADSAALKSNSGRTEGAIRHLYNAFWNIDNFCIYQQGLTDIMHTWWTIAWTMNWGRDKSYKICREVQERLDSERRRRSISSGGARRGPGGPMKRSTLALRARQVHK